MTVFGKSVYAFGGVSETPLAQVQDDDDEDQLGDGEDQQEASRLFESISELTAKDSVRWNHRTLVQMIRFMMQELPLFIFNQIIGSTRAISCVILVVG